MQLELLAVEYVMLAPAVLGRECFYQC